MLTIVQICSWTVGLSLNGETAKLTMNQQFEATSSHISLTDLVPSPPSIVQDHRNSLSTWTLNRSLSF